MYDVYIVWVESLTDAKSSAGRIDHQKAKRREHNHYTREGSTEARVGKCLRRKMITRHCLYSPTDNWFLTMFQGRIKRKGGGSRQVQRGFPPLFVCMVAFVSLAVGFFFRSG